MLTKLNECLLNIDVEMTNFIENVLFQQSCHFQVHLQKQSVLSLDAVLYLSCGWWRLAAPGDRRSCPCSKD